MSKGMSTATITCPECNHEFNIEYDFSPAEKATGESGFSLGYPGCDASVSVQEEECPECKNKISESTVEEQVWSSRE